MFIKKSVFDAQYRAYINALAEIAALQAENAKLREPHRTVREAVDRFCPPELRHSAEHWMRAKGI